MKIIVDMMGGDNAPLAVLEGETQRPNTNRRSYPTVNVTGSLFTFG